MTFEVTWFQRLANSRKGRPQDTIPQELADAWTDIMTEAVRAFHEPDFEMLPAMDYIDDLSDEDVKKRIAGYQKGYDLEYTRRVMVSYYGYAQKDFDEGTQSYEFAALPWPLQRAVVSHWDKLHTEFLRAHKGLCYSHALGYTWLFEENGEVAEVPYRDTDDGERPEKADMARLGQGPYGAVNDLDEFYI